MKCSLCFIDAGSQTCPGCGAPTCNNHIDVNGLCPREESYGVVGVTDDETGDDAETTEAEGTVKDDEAKEEETPSESPQPEASELEA